jgi:hypothetical protein
MTTSEQVHDDHGHEHGEGCGHAAFQHGDHVDYAHDGHVHRQVEGQWAECDVAEHLPVEAHDHRHEPGCGHTAIPHGDHVDYVHDGQRHAVHDGHYDHH